MRVLSKSLTLLTVMMLITLLVSCHNETIYVEGPRVNQVNIHPGFDSNGSVRGSIQVFIGAKTDDTVIKYALTTEEVLEVSVEDFESSESVLEFGESKGTLYKLITGLEDETYYNVFFALSLN